MTTDTPPIVIRSAAFAEMRPQVAPEMAAAMIDGGYYLANAGWLDQATVEAIQRVLYPEMLKAAAHPSSAQLN